MKWFVGDSKTKRFRIPFWGAWLSPYILQPRWLKRWYMRKSFEWWNHPSNHHWKGWLIGGEGDGPEHQWSKLERWWRQKTELRPGERDLWSGCYCSGENEYEQR